MSLSRDTRDNIFDPTRGSTVSLGLDFAGVGFGERFVRSVFTTTYFQPTPWLDHVLSFRLMAGYAIGWDKDPVPLFERFYLGGSNSLRQFKSLQVSPRDSSGTRVGGNSELLGTVEYQIPLFFGIKAAIFYDVGNVWGPDIADGSKIDLIGPPARGRGRASDGTRRSAPSGWTMGSNSTRRRARASGTSTSRRAPRSS